MEKRENKRGKRSRSKSNKKGIGHVEMIVSFSIFFLFVIFLFTYLNPIKAPSISKVLLDIVEQGLDNYTAKVLEIAVKVGSGGCFQIKCPFNDCSENNVFVKDKSGNVCGFNYGTATGNLSISGTGDFFYLYHSDKSIKPPEGSCSGATPRQTKFSVPKLQVLYLDSELERLNEEYENDYEGLKSRFGFPVASDFSISIEGMFTMSVTKPKGVAVIARDTPISILDGNTKEIIKGSMNIRVW